MKLIAVSLFALSTAALAFTRPVPTTMKGWVSDSKCHLAGAKHAACAKKCCAAGSLVVFISDKGAKVFSVDNQKSLMAHVGHHVTVSGTADGTKLHVTATSMR